MKKIFTLLSLFMFLGGAAFGQYYYIPNPNAGQNPGDRNNDDEFPSGGGLPAGWALITTGPSTTWTAAQTLPFAFSFNGNAVTNYAVHPSGVLTFTSNPGTSPAGTPTALPSGDIPDNSVCMWGLSIESGDYIVTKTFGTAPNRQHWVMFNSAHSAGTIDGWVYMSIVLEETTNRIYVVDQRINCVSGGSGCNGRPALSVGVQIDAATAIQDPSLFNYGGTAGNDPSPADNGYVSFVPGTQPANDIDLVDFQIEDFLILGDAPFTFSGSLRNLGSAALNSYDLTYTINGMNATNGSVSGQNVMTFMNGTWTHPTAWTPSAVGAYTIEISASNPNGGMDGDMTNNSITRTITVVDTFIQRKPLYEIFTSSTCGPCRPGNENFHNVVANYPDEDYVTIKYQQDFPSTGDPYATNESVDRRGYYGVNSIPRMEIDGGWDQNASSFTAQLHEDARDVPSFASMELEYEVSADSQKIDWCLDVEAFVDYGNLTLQFAVIESITFDNVKTNGETEFEQVMKKMVPSDNGRTITLNNGTETQVCDEYIFQGNYRLPSNGQTANRINHANEHSVEDFNNLYVIAWLQDDVTGEVHQAVTGTYRDTTGNGGGDTNDTSTFVPEILNGIQSINLYPNPTSAQTFLALDMERTVAVEVMVFDIVGQQVLAVPSTQLAAGRNQITLATEGLKAGTYFVTIQSEGDRQVVPLVIQK